MYRLIFLFILLISGSAAFAQISGQLADSAIANVKRDSLKIDSLTLVKNKKFIRPVRPSTALFTRDELFHDAKGSEPDTILDFFHRYNPVYQNTYAATALGVTGQVEKKLFYSDPFPENFRFRQDPFSIYQFNRNSLKYFDTRSPFTEITFVRHGRKEQYIQASHSRSFKRNFNAGFDFRKIKAEGLYKRQATDHGSFDIYARFTSPDNRYLANTGFIRNKSVVQENGGVAFDTIPSFFSGNKSFLSVNLSEALNQTKKKELFFDQTIYLGKRLEGDSLESAYVDPRYALTHSLSWDVQDDVYRDNLPPDNFYPSNLAAGVSINDSLRIKTLGNRLVFQSTEMQTSYSVKAGLSFHSNTFSKILSDTSFNTSFAFIEYGKTILNRFMVGASGSFSPFGYNSGDMKHQVHFSNFRDSSFIFFRLGYSYSLHEPDYLYKVYRSQLFSWYETDLKKVGSSEASFTVSAFKSKLSANFRYNEITNYTYIDSFFNIDQFSGNIRYLSASINAHLVIARRWNFFHELLWQNSSNNDVLRIPELAARVTYYYQNRIFKKRLEIQTGAELNYASPFYAEAYMPALRSFYLQNQVKAGGYPFVDIFFNFKVKARAKIFIKFEHVNSGFVYIPYYYVPVYPLPDRALKLGVNWKFFD